MFKEVMNNRLLFSILIPVLIIGSIFSLLLTQFLLPPITSLLKDRTDTSLKHSSDMGLSICEVEFNKILELRMEDNEEMNTFSKKDAIEQIKNISRVIPGTEMIIVNRDMEIIGSSFTLTSSEFFSQTLSNPRKDIVPVSINGSNAWMNYQFFPFWGWYIVSVIFEDDYMAPISMAKRIVTIGIFGNLGFVTIIVLFLFIWRINRPLKRIITATGQVSKGNLMPMKVTGKDEISKVSFAFNSMVYSLLEDKKRINTILKKLKNSEEQYRILTESSLANIAMVQNDNFVFANRMMLQSIGYENSQFVGLKFWEILHSKDINWVKDRINGLKKGQKGLDHFECRVRSNTGEILWFEMLATLVLYQEESAILIHAIDRTSKKYEELKRRELENKLSRAQKMEAIGALAGGVAHDLNNILSALVGYPDLLLLEMEENDPFRKPIETIQKSGQKAADIVQDMLTLARRGVAITDIVNLNDIISEYLKSPEHLKLTTFHPKVWIKTDLNPTLLNIKGSNVHLSKTIMNLISNAAESMPDGGALSIATANQYIDTPIGNYDTISEGDYVVVTISDTGIGIPAKDIEKIFEPFYTKKVMGRSGTGLGMAVVWGTVKDHKGYIDLDSTPDKGTRFSLYFPVARESLTREKQTFSIEKYKGNGETVLIIDDVKEQLELASSMLEQLNYSVSVAPSGEAAVQYMSTHSSDLLILDMIMAPGINGFETYKKILAFHPKQKAIIASGFSETSLVKNAQKLGAGKYIKKPYTLEKLGIAVKEELKN